MSIFSTISLPSLMQRRREVTRRLSEIQGSIGRAEEALTIINRLEVELPREIEAYRSRPHCPHIRSLWGGTVGADIDSDTVRLVQSTTALERLHADLPRLKRFWTDRLAALQKEAGTPHTASAQPAPATAAESPASAPVEAITDISSLSIGKVLEAVEAGEISAERALELERKSKRPRPSLMAQLQAEI